MRDKQAVDGFLKEFDNKIGLDKLKLIHANDSKFGLAEHKDRHEHIGRGQIGLLGFRTLVNHPKLKSVNMIIETKDDKLRQEDIKILKQLRRRKEIIS